MPTSVEFGMWLHLVDLNFLCNAARHGLHVLNWKVPSPCALARFVPDVFQVQRNCPGASKLLEPFKWQLPRLRTDKLPGFGKQNGKQGKSLQKHGQRGNEEEPIKQGKDIALRLKYKRKNTCFKGFPFRCCDQIRATSTMNSGRQSLGLVEGRAEWVFIAVDVTRSSHGTSFPSEQKFSTHYHCQCSHSLGHPRSL